MNDTFFIIFILSLIAANVVVFICVFAGRKSGKEDVRTILKASEDMITGLDRFRNVIPEMADKLVSDVKPAIDSYIRERVEAYLVGFDTTPQPIGDAPVTDFEPITDDVYQPTSNDSPVQDKPLANGLSYDDIEKVLGQVLTEDTYKRTFLRHTQNMFRASNGKQVSIREEYHKTLMWLLNAGAGECNTFTGFLDNLLAEHFITHGETIRNIVKSSNNIPEVYDRN